MSGENTLQPRGPLTLERLAELEDRLKNDPLCTSVTICAQLGVRLRIAHICFADALDLIRLARLAKEAGL